MKKIFISSILLSLISLPVFCKKKSECEQKLTMNEKVYGLSKLWSDIKYNFVYWDQLSTNYDSLYNEALSQILNNNDDYTYYRELQRIYSQHERRAHGCMATRRIIQHVLSLNPSAHKTG